MTAHSHKRPTMQELMKYVGITESDLEKPCSDKHATEFSAWLDWRRVALYLELNKTDITDIEVDNKEEPERRSKTLQKWMERYAYKATYKWLVEANQNAGKSNHAQMVCEAARTEKGSGLIRSRTTTCTQVDRNSVAFSASPPPVCRSQKRRRKPTDSTVNEVPITKKVSPSRIRFVVQFPGEDALGRFLKTRDIFSAWDDNFRFVVLHEPNQPQIVVTAKYASEYPSHLPTNACVIMLLPVLQSGTQPVSCCLASSEFLRCYRSENKPPVSHQLSPTDRDNYVVVPYETGFAAVYSGHFIPSLTDHTYVLTVSLGNLDSIRERSKVNELLDPKNKNWANFLSNAADALLKSIEMKPDLDVPAIIKEFITQSHPYPTPTD